MNKNLSLSYDQLFSTGNTKSTILINPLGLSSLTSVIIRPSSVKPGENILKILNTAGAAFLEIIV